MAAAAACRTATRPARSSTSARPSARACARGQPPAAAATLAAARPSSRRAPAPAAGAAAPRCGSSRMSGSLMPPPPFSASSDPRAASAAPPPPSSRSPPRSRGGGGRHEAQHDRRALTRRAARDRVPQLARRARCGARAAHGSSTAVELGDRQRPPGPRAVGVERLAVGDRQHPGAQVRVRPQARVGAQRRDERLLKAVLGVDRARPRRPASATRRRGWRRGSAETGAARRSRVERCALGT